MFVSVFAIGFQGTGVRDHKGLTVRSNLASNLQHGCQLLGRTSASFCGRLRLNFRVIEGLEEDLWGTFGGGLGDGDGWRVGWGGGGCVQAKESATWSCYS